MRLARLLMDPVRYLHDEPQVPGLVHDQIYVSDDDAIDTSADAPGQRFGHVRTKFANSSAVRMKSAPPPTYVPHQARRAADKDSDDAGDLTDSSKYREDVATHRSFKVSTKMVVARMSAPHYAFHQLAEKKNLKRGRSQASTVERQEKLNLLGHLLKR